MSDQDSFWDFYWETRLTGMENLGKRAAILAGSSLIRRLSVQLGRPIRLLELGCGEGQVIGSLIDAHASLCDTATSSVVDYNPLLLATCRRDYPMLRCIEGDFTDPELLSGLGTFDIVLLVNALHEVFSDTFSQTLGEVDTGLAKQRVVGALAGAASCLAPGAWMVLFDGLEPPGDPGELVRIRFLYEKARENFTTFASTYRPFKITFRELGDPLHIELPRRHFTRYITKSIFLGKRLWDTERLESYQYFNQQEFLSAFAQSGLQISSLQTLTVNDEKWQRLIEIDTPDQDFPQEHILILATKASS